MGWLSAILKGSSSSSRKSKREARCTCRDHNGSSTVDAADNFEDGSSDQNSEKEDIDCSTTDSLSGVGGQGTELDKDADSVEDGEADDNSYSGPWYSWGEDEGLALALQRKLSLESHQYHPHKVAAMFETHPTIYPTYRNYEPCHEGIDGWQCPGCMDPFWCAPECIQSQTITLPFADYEGNYGWPRPWPETYDNIHHPRLMCDVCGNPVTVDSSGDPQYRTTPIWGQTYCIKHEHDGTFHCFTCYRLEPYGAKYSRLRDGRRICSDCQSSAINDLHECRPLIEEIQRFYEGLDMKVYEQFPIELVDLEEMSTDGTTVGRTRSRECPLWTMISIPVFGHGNELTKIATEPHKLVSYKEVVKVQVLSHTPRLYTGMTLAHEMMHAWLRLDGSYLEIRGRDRELGYLGSESDKVHEGLCEVMAHMWLGSEIRAMSRSEWSSPSRLDFERKLARHLMRRIEESGDPTYGGGFRLVHPAVAKYGLKGTLDYIRMTGSFPV